MNQRSSDSSRSPHARSFSSYRVTDRDDLSNERRNYRVSTLEIDSPDDSNRHLEARGISASGSSESAPKPDVENETDSVHPASPRGKDVDATNHFERVPASRKQTNGSYRQPGQDADEESLKSAQKRQDSDAVEDELAETARLAVEQSEEGITPDASGLGFDPHAIWMRLLSDLEMRLESARFNTWVRDTKVLAYEDGEFIIGSPNAYSRDWLENRMRFQIKRSLRSLIGRSVDVRFCVQSRPVNGDDELASSPLYHHQAPRQETIHSSFDALQTSLDEHSSSHPQSSSQLSARRTFDTFVVGNHNRLAHAAASAISDHPGQQFNPLFIYGGVGLGKTHLLHAIGNRAQSNGYQTLYCSSEHFTNELISAIRHQGTEQFRNKYRQVDVLLIDDIQFIGGKESTQEEFFHTFNHLHACGSQVVLSSDRPPKALATLEERLRSRFEGGLQTDISQPDFETRVAILQSKATRLNIPIDFAILKLVAERVESNVRELEGALNHLYMNALLTNTALDAERALEMLEQMAPSRMPCPPSTAIRIIAEFFDFSVDEILGRKRTKDIAQARQIVMYILREEHCLSLPAIGQQLGGRDHSTVRHGVEKIAQLVLEDERVRQDVINVRQQIYTPFVG